MQKKNNLEICCVLTEFWKVNCICEINSLAKFINILFFESYDFNATYEDLRKRFLALIKKWQHDTKWNKNSKSVNLNSPWVLYKRDNSNDIYITIIAVARKFQVEKRVKFLLKTDQKKKKIILSIQPNTVLLSWNKREKFYKLQFGSSFSNLEETKVTVVENKTWMCKFRKKLLDIFMQLQVVYHTGFAKD